MDLGKQNCCRTLSLFDTQVGKRDKATMIYNTSLSVVFGIPKYAQTLHDQILERWVICVRACVCTCVCTFILCTL